MKQKPTDYRNRIKALEYVDAANLTAHPGNWRDGVELANYRNSQYNLIVSKDNQYVIPSLRTMREEPFIHQQPDLRRVSQAGEQAGLSYRRVYGLDRRGRCYVRKSSSFTKEHLLYQLPGVRRGIAQALSQGGM